MAILVVAQSSLSKSNIRILSVPSACKIPTTLKHIRYADFRTEPELGLSHPLDLELQRATFFDDFRVLVKARIDLRSPVWNGLDLNSLPTDHM